MIDPTDLDGFIEALDVDRPDYVGEHAVNTAPAQLVGFRVAAYRDRWSPFYRAYRITVGGAHAGILFQESPADRTWKALKDRSIDPEAEVHEFPTHAQAKAFIAPTPARPARPRKEHTVNGTINEAEVERRTRIEATAGATLVAKYKGVEYAATRVTDPAGWQVKGKGFKQATFASLSTAGRAITGSATNGWRFFANEVEAPAPADEAPAPKKARAPRKAKAAPVVEADPFVDALVDATLIGQEPVEAA